MQKSQILSLGALALAVSTLLVCHAAPRMPNAVRRLDVTAFPRQVGRLWRAGRDIATEPEVQRALPTAKIMERDYIDPAGRSINLLILNALDDQDFHKPDACLPGQGFKIDRQRTVTVYGQPANSMRSTTSDGIRYTLLYYWVKVPNRAAPAPGTLLGKLYGLRQLVDHETLSLFVRITMLDRQQDQPDLYDFSREVWDHLDTILGKERAQVVLRD